MKGPISKKRKRIILSIIVCLCAILLIITAIAEQYNDIKIALEYEADSQYDIDNNGVESIEHIVDLTVENTVFSWIPNENYLCTKWTVNDGQPLCYGALKCCSFLGLDPLSPKWDDPFYLSFGRWFAYYDNTVEAQVIYTDYNLDTPSGDVKFSAEKSLPVRFLGEAPTGMVTLGADNILSVEEMKDCTTKSWETNEVEWGTCFGAYNYTTCSDPPVNSSCITESKSYNYTCETGQQKVSHNKEICHTKSLKIMRGTEAGKIDFSSWGKCSTAQDGETTVAICDSKYDGNGDGICQSGESCVKFVITKEGVQRFVKNSRNDFVANDDSFFLQKLEYEVVK